MQDSDEPKYSIQLSRPALLRIVHPNDSSRYFDVDAYAANRMLEEANTKPSEDAKWEALCIWLGTKLGMTKEEAKEEISESNARIFWDAVCNVVKIEDEAIKKKLQSMQGLQLPTATDSLPDGNSGQNESSEHGQTPIQSEELSLS